MEKKNGITQESVEVILKVLHDPKYLIPRKSGNLVY